MADAVEGGKAMRESSIKAEEREITPEASDAGPISRLPEAEWKLQHDATGKTIFWAMVSIVVGFFLFGKRRA